MIGYLEGKLLKKEEDRILLLANQVGYEVLLPAVVMQAFKLKSVGDYVSLYIYWQQTERQPKPVLIGFNFESEKEFFQLFITVEDIGALKAVKALTMPIREIAQAIESQDLGRLRQLKGIGERTAQKIIATLHGKLSKFLEYIHDPLYTGLPQPDEFSKDVLNVLVHQLGHKTADAKQMISNALKRNPNILTPEELLEEIYRGRPG